MTMKIKSFLQSRHPGLFTTLKRVYQTHMIKRHKRMSRPEIETELKRMYRKRIGRNLDLDNPQRYTEKIQWAKLNDNDPTKALLSDKYSVRAWVAERVGEQYLVPLLGVWSDAKDVDFDILPKRFVLKTNNASGTNIIVSDANKINPAAVRDQLAKWLQLDFGWYSFEFQYLGIAPRIIAEEYLTPSFGETDLRDYKFLCFDGCPSYVWVDVNRSSQHARVVFDMDWNLQNWTQYDYPFASSLSKPESFEEMIQIAKSLSKGFPHVRVDLYEVNGRPYFGEMTFTNGSGFKKIVPEQYDLELGELWTHR